jgi:hypothetical protein
MGSGSPPTPELRALVEQELAAAVDPRVSEMAQAIAAKHPGASRAVLFYGSCLREKQLDGLMLDFYLIVSGYRSAYARRWLAAANRLIPPNVFYFEHDGLISKYAVLSEADFAHECSPDAWTVSTAARFAQPSRLVWSVGEGVSERVIDAISQASPTLLGWTLPAAPENVSSLDLWKRAFELTFAAELRAERRGRSALIVDADPTRYERFFEAMRPRPRHSADAGRRWWRRKQLKGKLYSVARLAKASLTFAGGADYIAWKINRHSDANIALKPWQRRHPLLAAISLLPRLLRSGAVR